MRRARSRSFTSAVAWILPLLCTGGGCTSEQTTSTERSPDPREDAQRKAWERHLRSEGAVDLETACDVLEAVRRLGESDEAGIREAARRVLGRGTPRD